MAFGRSQALRHPPLRPPLCLERPRRPPHAVPVRRPIRAGAAAGRPLFAGV